MRGDGAVEDVDGNCPPQDGRAVGDDDDDDFPLQEGSSLMTHKCRIYRSLFDK